MGFGSLWDDVTVRSTVRRHYDVYKITGAPVRVGGDVSGAMTPFCKPLFFFPLFNRLIITIYILYVTLFRNVTSLIDYYGF